MTEEIPQSPILSEVRAGSISELFSRDPESFTDEDRIRLVETLRQHRERLQAAGATTKPKSKAAPTVQTLDINPADLGL